jgi:MFS family permease
VPRNLLRPVNLLITTHGLASFTFGLVFPYTAIYLADAPHVGDAGVALYYASAGGANLVAALLLTTGVLKLSRGSLGVLGTLLWFAGYLALPTVGSVPGVMVAAMAIGAGQGGYLAAIVPLINSLVTAEERRAVFARRYAVLNGTLAAGSLLAGLLTLALPRSVIPAFFVANAVGILPLTLAIAVAARHAKAPVVETELSGKQAVMPVFALWKVALPAAAFQLAMYLLGFSQFEATAPLVSTKLMDMSLFVVSLLLGINAAVTVGMQSLVTRLLKSRPEMTGLRIAVLLWMVGYVLVGALAAGPSWMRLAGLLLYAVFFALGECAYSCSFHPWLISLVPESELTRASALANSMMGVGNFTGPSLGIALAATGNATVVWLGLAMCCTLVTGLVSMLYSRRLVTLPSESRTPA